MLRKRKLTVRAYRVEATGERADGTPSPFTKVHTRHVFDVPGSTERTAERFVELAVTKYCSVASSLHAEQTFEVVLEHDRDRERRRPRAPSARPPRRRPPTTPDGRVGRSRP
jgi:uncharacterized OsmC-like protein